MLLLLDCVIPLEITLLIFTVVSGTGHTALSLGCYVLNIFWTQEMVSNRLKNLPVVTILAMWLGIGTGFFGGKTFAILYHAVLLSVLCES